VRHARALVDAAPPSIGIHSIGANARTTLARNEVIGWVALMTLGVLPSPGLVWPGLDVGTLLERTRPHELAKIRCVFQYFEHFNSGAPKGSFEVERVVLAPRTAMEWSGDASPLTPVTLDPTGLIEDAPGDREADFANASLGGGVLRSGCVQEEIRFVVAPELLAAMIVSPRLRDDEAVVMRGAERFAAYRGYATELEYAGPFDDPCARGPDGTPDIELVAIDAIDYRKGDARDQFTDEAMLRELAKARAGWRREARSRRVSTGNWGCGAFLGDPPLKAVIQWIAASAEGRAMRYCTFGEAKLGDFAGFTAAALTKVGTAGALWSRLRVAAREGGGAALYDRLLSSV
jgi:poly(ADP-ribose) glycohydrolase